MKYKKMFKSFLALSFVVLVGSNLQAKFFKKIGSGVTGAWDATTKGVTTAFDATKSGVTTAFDATKSGVQTGVDKTVGVAYGVAGQERPNPGDGVDVPDVDDLSWLLDDL